MRYAALPHTDLSASVLCLGCGPLGAEIDQENSFRMLDAFIEGGGNFLDTAKVYSDWIPGESSRSEKLLGAWMTERRNRDKIILATKGAHPNLDSMEVPRLSPTEIVFDLEASLCHLQTEIIDLYWLHRDDPNSPVGEILETLQQQVKKGKIRVYGGSNWSLKRIQEAQTYAETHGLTGFAAVQNLWNLAMVNPDGFADPTMVMMDEALWKYHRETNIPAVPYTSQVNGLFQKMETTRVEDLPDQLKAWYINPVTMKRSQRLQDLRKRSGLTTTQIVLGYLLSQPFQAFPIIGPKSLAQLTNCLTAGDVRLSQEEVDRLLR